MLQVYQGVDPTLHVVWLTIWNVPEKHMSMSHVAEVHKSDL